jgi:hypothetical protein
MKWSKGKGRGVSNGRGSGCAPHVQRDLVASRRDSPHVLPCHALVPATVSTRLVLVLHFDYEAMCVLAQRRVLCSPMEQQTPTQSAPDWLSSTRADRTLAFGASKTEGEPSSPLVAASSSPSPHPAGPEPTQLAPKNYRSRHHIS